MKEESGIEVTVADPITDFGLDLQRLGDATYRRHERNRVIREIGLSDAGLIYVEGRPITRNEVIDEFKLLDNPTVCDYLKTIHGSPCLRGLWARSHPVVEGTEGWQADWTELIHHPAHAHFGDRWRVQWRAALNSAFRMRVNVNVFSSLVASCELDGALGSVCYEDVVQAVQQFREDVESLAERLDEDEAPAGDVDWLFGNAPPCELIGCLPSACNNAKLRCAHALHQLSLGLHNADRPDETSIRSLELARAVAGDCEVGKYYASELAELHRNCAVNRDWAVVNDFAVRLGEMIAALHDQTPCTRAAVEMARIVADAVEAIYATNRLPDDEEDAAAARDDVAGKLLALANDALTHTLLREFVSPLLQVATAVRCRKEIKEEIEKAVALVKSGLPSTGAAPASSAEPSPRSQITDSVDNFEKMIRNLLISLQSDDVAGWKRERLATAVAQAADYANSLNAEDDASAAVREQVAKMLMNMAGIAFSDQTSRAVTRTIIDAAKTVRCGTDTQSRLDRLATLVDRSALQRRKDHDSAAWLTILAMAAMAAIVLVACMANMPATQPTAPSVEAELPPSQSNPTGDTAWTTRYLPEPNPANGLAPSEPAFSGGQPEIAPASESQVEASPQPRTESASPSLSQDNTRPAASSVTPEAAKGTLVVDNQASPDDIRAVVERGGEATMIAVAGLHAKAVFLPVGDYTVLFITRSDKYPHLSGGPFRLRGDACLTLSISKADDGNYQVQTLEQRGTE